MTFLILGGPERYPPTSFKRWIMDLEFNGDWHNADMLNASANVRLQGIADSQAASRQIYGFTA